MTTKPKINFIGIGAPRSGTTWVAQCLAEHPDICVSKPKELNFFTETMPSYYPEKSGMYHKGFDWYTTHFTHCPQNALLGEFSITYLYDPVAAKRIYKTYPDATILVCLRNPIEQMVSHIQFKKRHTIGTNFNDYQTAVTMYPDFIHMAQYSQALARYKTVFGDKLHIIWYDDIISEPRMVLKKLYSKIGAKPDFIPPSTQTKIHTKHFTQGFIRTQLLHGLEIMKYIPGFGTLLGGLRKTSIFQTTELFVQKIDFGAKVLTLPPPSKAEKQYWYTTYFAEDIAKLEKITKKNLDNWKIFD